MSSNNVVENTGQQAIITTDPSKIFIWGNRYENGSCNNATYDPVTLLAGRLMGRVSATGLLAAHDSSATDGSQFPVGILAQDVTIEEGSTKPVSICVAGDVVEDKVLLASGDTLETVISDRRIRDRIAADTVGIKLVPSTENSYYDNQ